MTYPGQSHTVLALKWQPSESNSSEHNVGQHLAAEGPEVSRPSMQSIIPHCVTQQSPLSNVETCPLDVRLNNNTLDVVREQKLLGVIIDHNLCWKTNVEFMHTTISRKIALFKKIKQNYRKIN